MALPRYEGSVQLPGPEQRQVSIAGHDLAALDELTNATLRLIEVGGAIHQRRGEIQAQSALFDLEQEGNAFVEQLQRNQDPETWDEQFQQFRSQAVSSSFDKIRNPYGQNLFERAAEVEMEKFRHALALAGIKKSIDIDRRQSQNLIEKHIQAGNFEMARGVMIDAANRGAFDRAEIQLVLQDVEKRAYFRQAMNEATALWEEQGISAALDWVLDPSNLTVTHSDPSYDGEGNLIPQGSVVPILGDADRQAISDHLQRLQDMRDKADLERRKQELVLADSAMTNALARVHDGEWGAANLDFHLRNSPEATALWEPGLPDQPGKLRFWLKVIEALKANEEEPPEEEQRMPAAAKQDIDNMLENELTMMIETARTTDDYLAAWDFFRSVAYRFEVDDDGNYILDDNGERIPVDPTRHVHSSTTLGSMLRRLREETRHPLKTHLWGIVDEHLQQGLFGVEGERDNDQLRMYSYITDFVAHTIKGMMSGQIRPDMRAAEELLMQKLQAPLQQKIHSDTMRFRQGFGTGILRTDKWEAEVASVNAGAYEGIWHMGHIKYRLDDLNKNLLGTFFATITGDPDQRAIGYEIFNNDNYYHFRRTGQMYFNFQGRWLTFAFPGRQIFAYEFSADRPFQPGREVDVDWNEWRQIPWR